MTAKKYLRSIRTQNKCIDSLIAEKDRLTAIAEGVSGMSYDSIKVQSARVTPGSRQTDAVCKLCDLEERITNEIDMYVDMREEAARAIDKLPEESERTVLRYRYLCGMTWAKIAERMNYEVRQIYRLHGRALQHIEDYIPKCQ